MNQLEDLKKYTTVVADSGDFESIKKYRPTDATTNPSLILAASQKEIYRPLIEEAILFGKKEGRTKKETVELALDKLFINFGLEILKIVPNRVSIEVDARLSFDTESSIERAKRLILFFKERKIEKERILIKLASTWEGIKAAKELEKEGIHCNMTLIFSQVQAIASAEANATLISPFVGRILDWHMKQFNKEFSASEDPGVISVKNIYDYFKKFEYKTEIMGASFRNKNEIIELAGCDLLTIAPSLLEELERDFNRISPKLSIESAKKSDMKKIKIDEKNFRYLLNDNAMATDKLSEGIRRFCEDIKKLETKIEEIL